jgi:tetraacyldisaccharide 4'-kinase
MSRPIEILSGQAQDIGARTIRPLLWGLAAFYCVGVTLRNAAFRWGLWPIVQVGVPVISLGNITAGGTGKTPLTAWVVNQLLECRQKPAILSRGYGPIPSSESAGRSLGESIHNDEYLVLADLCPGVPHLQGVSRCDSAKRAIREYEATTLVLDDGFQHRKLSRSLDIVLVDATNPWGYGYLLPRGLLREPVSSLKRADFACVTRVNLVSPDRLAAIRETIERYLPRNRIAEVEFQPIGWRELAGQVEPLGSDGEPVIAFCGIGNPEGFRHTLEAAGAKVAEFVAFPDHYHYQAADVERLIELATSRNCRELVTTHKDLVKLSNWPLERIGLRALAIGPVFRSGEHSLRERLQATLADDAPSQQRDATR